METEAIWDVIAELKSFDDYDGQWNSNTMIIKAIQQLTALETKITALQEHLKDVKSERDWLQNQNDRYTDN